MYMTNRSESRRDLHGRELRFREGRGPRRGVLYRGGWPGRYLVARSTHEEGAGGGRGDGDLN